MTQIASKVFIAALADALEKAPMDKQKRCFDELNAYKKKYSESFRSAKRSSPMARMMIEAIEDVLMPFGLESDQGERSRR